MIDFLARYRVRLGFLAAALAIWFARPTRTSALAGAIVACAGEGIRIWAAGHLEKGREVTASGPYRLTRHPLYLGSLLIGVGVALACANVVAALLVLGYLAVTLTAAIRSEEAHLTAKFGSAYPAYREGRAPGVHRRFSVERAVRNREYRAATALVIVLALLAWKVL